uniref:Uncharacterized protein n=1 Tax=Aegilops tauschii subsp. strangulata TaxID=200361 RepID=A0A453RPC6_AEGTS
RHKDRVTVLVAILSGSGPSENPKRLIKKPTTTTVPLPTRPRNSIGLASHIFLTASYPRPAHLAGTLPPTPSRPCRIRRSSDLASAMDSDSEMPVASDEEMV